jgi:Predicted permeases
MSSVIDTFWQILIMLVFVAAGYLLSRSRRLDANAGKILSNLLLYIFVPAVYFRALFNNMQISLLAENLSFFIAGSIVMVLSGTAAWFVGSATYKENNKISVVRHSLTFPNGGYFGNPLVLAIYGELMLKNLIVFNIPYTIAMFTWGMFIFNPKEVRQNSKKLLRNVPILAVIAGAVCGLVSMPHIPVLDGVVEAAANCMSPCAMILTGVILGTAKPKWSAFGGRVLMVSVVRLILFPLVFGGAMYLLGLAHDIIVISTVTLAMPAGLNMVIFDEIYGEDDSFGAIVCVVSTVLSLLTIPIVVYLLDTFI